MGFWKGSKLYSILKLKCPRCHQGDLFLHKNAYKLSKLGDMPKNCPDCGLKYEKEPGYFYGAMFISYGLTVGISIVVFLILSLLVPSWPLEYHIPVIAAVLVLLTPLNFRWSRAIWMNFFTHFIEDQGLKK